MKLQYQLNAAFTALLLVIMAVTGYFIYSLILDILIQDEQRQLKQKGEILIEVLNEENYGDRESLEKFSRFLDDQDLQLFLYDRKNNAVFYSTMPNSVAQGFFNNNNFADNKEALWEFENNKYVTSRIVVYPANSGLELILLTPMNDLQAVQQNFVFRLFIVFMIGGIAAVLLSYFLTKKLVTPLTMLKVQLKKVEKRKFDDLERVEASGEIKEVEESVFEMAEELKNYMKSQQTFFQNASHELKTPLMTIQGYAEGIKDGIFDEGDKENGLEVMVTEVKRLKLIINEMILLAKLDSEPDVYQPEKITGETFLKQIVDRALPLVNERGIHFTHQAEDNCHFIADEEKLLRAILNLIVNGIRHANTKISLQIFKRNGATYITVEDDGEGIADEMMPHIFHRFVKGKNGETGLGLAISRAIIERSGGKITVDKSTLGGAKFIITFPGN